MVEAAERKDFEELLKFENKTFKIKFEEKVPRVYAFSESTDIHGVFKVDGKIVGGICVLPGEFRFGNEKLVTAGIGSVAVSKSFRDRGIMKELMEFAGKRSEELGADVGYLSGYRLRYERFGYVPSGIKYVFEVTDHFVSRCKTKENFSFSPVQSEKDFETAERFYNSLPARHLREHEKFEKLLSMWYSKALLVLDENGDAVGYLIYKKDENAVSELILSDNAKARDVLVSFARAKKLKNIFAWACDFQRELLKELLSFGEHYRIDCACSLKIFNFRNFIEKMLRLRVSLSPLVSGSLVLKIGEETLKITVDGKNVSVTETEETAELSFSKTDATIALTRPESATTENALFNAWAPLCPFGIFSVDEV
ncbi:MAG: GNAT family N-acetyltransferase [Clostridia bacterium]|nr:GNAT family N-acetyltransferase [Clostridia bacterium]